MRWVMIDKIDKILEENLNWKTRSSFFSYVRGGIRSGLWNKSPIKLNYIKEKRIQIPNPNERGNKPTVWGAECNICEGLFPLKDMNVDHIRDTGSSLKTIDDIQQFIEDIVIVTKDELRLVCKGCHNIESYRQKHNMTFAEAKVHKEVIEICKDKQKVVDKLSGYGVEYIPTTAKARREMLTQIMLKELENDS